MAKPHDFDHNTCNCLPCFVQSYSIYKLTIHNQIFCSAQITSNLWHNNKGAFNNYVDRILPFFDLPPLAWTVFIPWAWTKTDFFDPLPSSSCPRSYWMPPNVGSSRKWKLSKKRGRLSSFVWSKFTNLAVGPWNYRILLT